MKTVPTPKLYYSIKQVGEMFDEEQHILRYWEREFDMLKPQKNRAGNRVYTEKDLRVLRVIKKLLRQDRLSVTQAKAKLEHGIPTDLENVASDEVTYSLPGVAISVQKNDSISKDMVSIPKSDIKDLLALLQELSTLITKI
ncbi:MAG: MerR family transcriptional regulator [Candidatus Kapabacteria bacterium]|nr:MerR family transcriptional regulator [Candidatus Kapabacteria bacterium]MBX7155538.1 MerR family transcriptional regulator [Bacteroidota bacterium]